MNRSTSIRGRYPQKPIKAPVNSKEVVDKNEARRLLMSVCAKLMCSIDQETLVCVNADRKKADIAFVIGTREMRLSISD